MPTLFKRTFDTNHEVIIHTDVTPDCEWVINGEGIATRKLDGTCTRILNGELWKRYDAKAGKPIPIGAIKCQDEPDSVTGHLPCWVKVDMNDKADKWFTQAFKNQVESGFEFQDGTYELCGPHFQSNPEQLEHDIFILHGSVVLNGVPRTFEEIRQYLFDNNIEGIVFHRDNGQMCKIKRTDFGFEWNHSTVKRK